MKCPCVRRSETIMASSSSLKKKLQSIAYVKHNKTECAAIPVPVDDAVAREDLRRPLHAVARLDLRRFGMTPYNDAVAREDTVAESGKNQRREDA